MYGKVRERLDAIMPRGRAMILAYDQGLEHGPRDFLDNPRSIDFGYILDIAEKGKFTGLVIHAGLAEKYQSQIKDSGVPLILKLNGTTELFTDDDPYSPQFRSVQDAIELGATAVGYTVYTGSRHGDLMHREFADVIREAHARGLPAVGWMYPRGKALSERKSSSKTFKLALQEQEKTGCAIDETPSIVGYGARVGLELGADILKLKYTGTIEGFRWVVRCAGPAKVVMSGGVVTKTDEEFLTKVQEVIEAGAAGVAVGRNIWQRQDPLVISQKLHRAIFG